MLDQRFFKSGNTDTILRQTIKNQYHNGISFQKVNIFRFNSESFRYLVTQKCFVNYSEFLKQGYMRS